MPTAGGGTIVRYISDIRQTSDIEPPAPEAPDYELEPTVRAEGPEQLKALADHTRSAILDLVLERAATTTELAEALGKPKGTIDHHLKVLQRAGLVRVVRTRKVRAITECFWGRTGRTIQIEHAPVLDDSEADTYFISTALRELRGGRRDPADESGYSTLRHARVPKERLEEFIARLDALAVEFASSKRGGDTVYGLLLAVYPTTLPTLKDPKEQRDER